MASIDVKSEITGKVWKIEAKPGDHLAEDDPDPRIDEDGNTRLRPGGLPAGRNPCSRGRGDIGRADRRDRRSRLIVRIRRKHASDGR